ncbi:MAG: PGPGW domain-containing protein [Solirubrobacteraceae bacterium]
MESEPRPRPKLIQKLEARRADHIQRGLFYRILFAVAGATVLIGGLVMLVTPGPAFVLIPIGLAMLSLEFVWAERMLDGALDRAQIAKEKAATTSRRQRILGVVAGALAFGAAVTAQIEWDILPFLPFP